MPEPLALFSQDDVKFLKDFIADVRRLQKNTPLRQRVEEIDTPTPEVYIVFTPLAGIPANNEHVTGTTYDDTLGYADCPLYRTVESGGTRIIKPLGVTKRIYNLAPVAVPGQTWISVIRDKFGLWFAQPFAGSIASNLKVQDVSGLPSVSGVIEILLDQTTGLQIEVQGPGTGTIPITGPANSVTICMVAASDTRMGAVTISAQKFAGAKTFVNTVEIQGTGLGGIGTCLTVDGSQVFNVGTGQTVTWVNSGINLVQFALGLGASPAPDGGLFNVHTWSVSAPGGSGGLPSIALEASTSGGSYVLITVGDGGSPSKGLAVKPIGAGTTFWGASGTDGAGNSFMHGICYAVGSGGAGTITGITNGNGITGGGTSGNLTLSVNAGGGLTFSSGALIPNLGNGLTISGGQIVPNVNGSLTTSSGQLGIAAMNGTGAPGGALGAPGSVYFDMTNPTLPKFYWQ